MSPPLPPLNPDPALLPVMGVMRRNGEGGGDQPGVVKAKDALDKFKAIPFLNTQKRHELS